MVITDEELDKWVSENINEDSPLGKAFINMMEKESAKEVEIDHDRMVEYLKSVHSAKKFLEKNNCEYKIEEHMFDVTKTDCRYDILCDVMNFEDVGELYSFTSKSSWICIGMTNDDKVRMSVEFWKVAKERGEE